MGYIGLRPRSSPVLSRLLLLIAGLSLCSRLTRLLHELLLSFLRWLRLSRPWPPLPLAVLLVLVNALAALILLLPVVVATALRQWLLKSVRGLRQTARRRRQCLVKEVTIRYF